MSVAGAGLQGCGQVGMHVLVCAAEDSFSLPVELTLCVSRLLVVSRELAARDVC